MSELLTRQFYDWEQRGRGWAVWPAPVDLEPPFRPFHGHFVQRPEVDDGQFDTGLSLFADSFKRLLGFRERRPEVLPIEEAPEPEPDVLKDPPRLVELHTLLPANLEISRESFEQFFISLSLCREPVAFELLGSHSQIGVQFAVHPSESALVSRQLEAFFPEAVFLPQEDTLRNAWNESETAVVEFGLGREFMLRLTCGKLDPFVGVIGALSTLDANELGLVQVLFRRVRQPWTESILRAVTDNRGEAFFSNAPEILDEARKKVSRPLYAVVVRIATQADDFERTWEIARNLAGSFHTFSNPTGNELIPLTNDDYPHARHIQDVLGRQSRRSGMLLNSDELIGFVHLPGTAVRSAKLLRETKKSKAAPAKLTGTGGVLLGQNTHLGRTVDVRIAPDDRVRHTHLIGASGTGKSNLLLNLICQDIANGDGVGVLDPHGDLVDDILARIPPDRINDVVLVDPSDEDYSVGFNILSAHSDLEKTLLASDLVSVFQRLSTSWGDQMGSVLQNAILAFLESREKGTLADMRRFLVDIDYRDRFLETVQDPDVVYYWRKTFPQLTGNRSIGPVLTRLETFLSPKSIRYMVSQRANKLDFANILDSGKIFLAKLSQGQIGRENAFLMGSLFVAKFQQTAMSRQRMAKEARRDYWLYIDEFHNFITPSMAEILTGARKYRLGLTLAHQELRQLQRDSEVAGAVMSNSHTRVVFRVGDEDARKLADGFSFFETKDLQSLGIGDAIGRVERSNFDFNLTIPLSPRPDPQAAAGVQAVISASRARYATPRAEVQSALMREMEVAEPETKSPPPPPKKRPLPKDHAPHPTPEPADVQPEAPTEEEEREVPPAPVAPTAAPEPQEAEGGQHERIKERIRVQGESLDYSVTIEEFVLDGGGRADVVLRRGERTIACEISVTTTVEHEIGNVTKCLKAGFKHVAMICLTRKKADLIRQGVEAAVPETDPARVGYYLCDEFLTTLHDWAIEDPSGGQLEKGKLQKQKIGLGASQMTEIEREQQRKKMLQQIAENMKRKKSE